mmetsp:Transcript_51293/g.134699  ORF Transcript_51293/g.134699 Transcript_51293/m.134699 type:complete len:376 (-) Transcript_51293:100-1227(-)
MVSVVSVGCGAPKLGMGWYHLTQLLEEPSVRVRAVVEPWFLGPGIDAPGAQAFRRFREDVQSEHPEVNFLAAVEDLPDFSDTSVAGGAPTLAVIASRTCDALGLFRAVCNKGVTHVYVEKPGAETAEQLKEMQEIAASSNVAVLVGYNKNVSQYIQDALAEIDKSPAPLAVTLEHNNPFKPGNELMDFAGGPGGEGLVHNMFCHELALAVSFFGLTCDSIQSLTLDAVRSELFHLPDGRTDWQSLAFRVALTGEASRNLTFFADRCGGNFSCVHLGDAGTDRRSFRLPSTEHETWVETMREKDSEIRGYFLLQSPDYRRLKRRFIDHILEGEPGVPHGAVDLAGALEVLRLADLIAPLVKDLWTGGEPWQWFRKH